MSKSVWDAKSNDDEDNNDNDEDVDDNDPLWVCGSSIPEMQSQN